VYLTFAGYKGTNQVLGGLGQDGKEATRGDRARNVDSCGQIKVNYIAILPLCNKKHLIY
jgi:hypothetical protein